MNSYKIHYSATIQTLFSDIVQREELTVILLSVTDYCTASCHAIFACLLPPTMKNYPLIIFEDARLSGSHMLVMVDDILPTLTCLVLFHLHSINNYTSPSQIHFSSFVFRALSLSFSVFLVTFSLCVFLKER